MKKSTILGLVTALFMGQSAMAQGAQEISYVEAPEQGYLFNSFSNNWFVSVEGGVNYYLDAKNEKRDFLDRFSPNAGFWVGKWFSPIAGARVGGNFTQLKKLSKNGGLGYYGTFEDYDKYHRNEFGFAIDGMLNLTNWWCGYRPGRCYNAIFYGGAGYNWVYFPEKTGSKTEWKHDERSDDNLTAHVGLINNFNLNKHIAIYLDLRAAIFEDETDNQRSRKTHIDPQAYLGLTYNFNKTTWSAPIVPVIPEIPNCDEIEARLQAANGRIADLENQLRDCLNRPAKVVTEKAEGPICTVYYSIGSSRISRVDNKVLGAIAQQIKNTPDQKYDVIGWADNYTGTDAVNDRLRLARANGVKKVLVRNGVAESQLNVKTDANNRMGNGEANRPYIYLDRAVTIEKQ